MIMIIITILPDDYLHRVYNKGSLYYHNRNHRRLRGNEKSFRMLLTAGINQLLTIKKGNIIRIKGVNNEK